MATLICLPLEHGVANGNPIRKMTADMWRWPGYYIQSIHWHIIAKGNIIEGITVRD